MEVQNETNLLFFHLCFLSLPSIHVHVHNKCLMAVSAILYAHSEKNITETRLTRNPVVLYFFF